MSDVKTALIIDNEPDAISIIEAMLCDINSLETISALSGDEGYKKAVQNKPDIIILDIQMPGKNGFEVFSDLKKNEITNKIPVVMVTGVGEKTGFYFSSGQMGEYIGIEPDAYIEKPVDSDLLQKTVSELIDI